MSKKAAATSAAVLKLLVPAAKAAPTPPVGPALGQRGIKAIDFCRQFNEQTKDLQPDTPIPVVLTANPDRTFSFILKTPPTAFLLKRAAGIDKGTDKPGERWVGRVSVKHVYEIARIKQQDENLRMVGLESLCKSIVASARSIGIEVVF